MELIPITQSGATETETNKVANTRSSTVKWYETIGYEPPWIGYFARVDNMIVGSCAFKGAPKAGKVEIAYQTFEDYRSQGHGSAMCHALKLLARKIEPSLDVTARTLREAGHSTRILEKNGFVNSRDMIDHDGTPVWEWVLKSD